MYLRCSRVVSQDQERLSILPGYGLEEDHTVGDDVMIGAVVCSLEVRQIRGHGQPYKILVVDLNVLTTALHRETPAFHKTIQLYVIQVDLRILIGWF